MTDTGATIEVQRLSDLDTWEFYQLIDTTNGETLVSIGLRSYPEFKEVEYGIWRLDRDDDDAACTGSVTYDNAQLGVTDGCREEVLTRIVNVRRSELGIGAHSLTFRLDNQDDVLPVQNVGGD